MQSFYSDQRTWLHAVPAGWKVLALLTLGVGLYATEHPNTLGAAAGVCVCVYASLGRVGWRSRNLLWPLGVACVLVLGFHGYLQQIHLGWISATRMLSITLMGVAFTLTTHPSALLHTLESALQPLQAFGLPSQRIALQFALMMRFIEHFFMLWQQLDDAHKIRTGKSAGLRLLSPLSLHMLQAAKRVADTLTLRLPR